MILETLGLLLVVTLVLIFITAALAPTESLRWWAGWYTPEDEPDAEVDTGAGGERAAPAQHYLVYLSGIGAISGASVPQEEVPFIEGLGQRLPNSVVVADVFPYAVANNGLNGQRAFAGMWKWVEGRRLKNPMDAAALIVNLRNAFQVAVSADQRYGPVFNLAVAQEIQLKLREHGYPKGGGIPVTLVGWSGGGQVAVGAAGFLWKMLGAPLHIVSVGGLLTDDPGLNHIEHLWHLYGTKDVVSPVGKYAYAGRWPIFSQSAWNVALHEGKITFIELGPFTHNGKGNYFDDVSTLPDGQPYLEHTLDEVQVVIHGAGLDRPPSLGPVPAAT